MECSKKMKTNQFSEIFHFIHEVLSNLEFIAAVGLFSLIEDTQTIHNEAFQMGGKTS